MEKLDTVVAEYIEQRLLEPKRLEQLLSHVLDRRTERAEQREIGAPADPFGKVCAIAGDIEGARLIAIVIVAMALAERSRSNRSRTIARPSTMPAHPPQASITRPTISIGNDQASPHTTVPARNRASPAISTRAKIGSEREAARSRANMFIP